MIPFLDLKSPYLELKREIDEAMARVANSGWYIGGPEVEQFEAAYAQYCGATEAVGVANGLDALHLALLAMDVGPGDEVIVPSNTYIATWLAVSQVPMPSTIDSSAPWVLARFQKAPATRGTKAPARVTL